MLNEAKSDSTVPIERMSKWKAVLRRLFVVEVEEAPKNNLYDKGFIHNVQEVIFPHSTRRTFNRIKSKLG